MDGYGLLVEGFEHRRMMTMMNYNFDYYPRLVEGLAFEKEVNFVSCYANAETFRMPEMVIADPRLIKIIVHDDEPVGFLFAFPDVSAALQRARGRLFPFGLIDLLLELRRTKWVSLNGAGILPEFQGRGGNALLYSEMEKTVRDYGFQHADLTQVAETAVQMRRDLENVGAKAYKNHRVYRRTL